MCFDRFHFLICRKFLQIETTEGDQMAKKRGKSFFSFLDYDYSLIPPEPDFFTAGLSMDLTDM